MIIIYPGYKCNHLKEFQRKEKPQNDLRFRAGCYEKKQIDSVEKSRTLKTKVLLFLAKNRNFDRNPLRGCNLGSEGGAVLDSWGCTIIVICFYAKRLPTNWINQICD